MASPAIPRTPVPRRYRPLTALVRPRPLHAAVEAAGLPVRRPFWLLAARYARMRLGRLHFAPSPLVPPSPATSSSGLSSSAPFSSAPSPVAAGLPLAAGLPVAGAVAPLSPATAAGARVPAGVPEIVHREPLTRHPVTVARPRTGAQSPQPAPSSDLTSAIRARTRGALSVRRALATVPTPFTATAPVARAPEPVSYGRVEDLTVLGGAPVAVPEGGFDAAAAVTVPPRPPSPVAPIRAGFPGTVAGPGTFASRRLPMAAAARRGAPVPAPEARWRAAVAARPLEHPRPFPTGLRPLVTALTGGAHRAAYTTGPATRGALAAAGALGATTGTVVHLPTAPTAGPGPLLGIVAHELAHARSPVSRPRFLLGIPHGAADAEERAAQAVGQRVQAAGDQVRGLGTRFGQELGAGIVGDLPVGGSGRIPDVRGAARSALEGTVDGAVDRALPDVSLPQLRLPEVSLPDVSVPQVHLPEVPSAQQLEGRATAALEQAGGAVSHAASALLAGGPGGGFDIDHLAEVLEQRVLRQIERRGGRYSGMF